MKEADFNLINDLILRAKRGDQAAFGEIYRDYFTPVYRYLLVRIGHKAAAEDLAQTVFLKVYSAIGRFELSQGKKLLPYFFTVARNTVIDYYRKKKILAVDADALKDLADPGQDGEERFAAQEQKEEILAALRTVNLEEQEAIAGKYLNDLSNAEIAEFLGKTEAAVRQLQCRGLKKLRLILKKDE